MARTLNPLVPIVLFLSISSGGTMKLVKGEVDCGFMKKKWPCFYPDSLINHASVVMNLYYQSRGRNPWNCFFKNSAIVTVTDPSYGNCVYAYYA
ncbi:Glucan endo-1,3-beta-D-glucosidase [Acorus calamus]|uniref:Glucan endo-1,3-beta-D-glucosidase n=1 Tax=Acorus calamus TaxID=4465 RepID=A0AAV9DKP2_ACOCL|nr:Glucan endo-1,3-beta-D-glucosidase [Acorus calamus]